MTIRDSKYRTVIALSLALSFNVYAQNIDVQSLLPLAQAGDAVAQHEIAVHYAIGDGVASDQVEAVKWYMLAAEQGHAEAQITLASKYALGQGVEKNQSKAFKWYRRAADQGSAEAKHTLAVHYALGSGVEKDDREAVYWYTQSADKGLAVSQHTLAVHYALGMGVAEDQQEATRLYQKAAEQSLVVAQETLQIREKSALNITNSVDDLRDYAEMEDYAPANDSYETDLANENDPISQDRGTLTEEDTSLLASVPAATDGADNTTVVDEEFFETVESEETAPSESIAEEDVPKVAEEPKPTRVAPVVESQSAWGMMHYIAIFTAIVAGFVFWRRRVRLAASTEKSENEKDKDKQVIGYW